MKNSSQASSGARGSANGIISLMLLAVFGVGTVEYLVAGVLPEISGDMGVSEANAGLLVTVYALTVMIGGPLLTVITSKIPAQRLVAILMGLFVLGNLATVLAPNFPLLLAARVLTALPHATFFAFCLVVATTLVEPEFQGRVIARITLGLNFATVLGVPLGTLIGHQLGWRASFWIIAIFQSVVTLLLLMSSRNINTSPPDDIKSELRVFTKRPVLAAIGLTALSQAALFVVFTYIAPYLTQVSGVPTGQITAVLFCFGLGSIAGNQIGGRLADKDLTSALAYTLFALAMALGIQWLIGGITWASAAWMFVLGAAGFSIIPPLASRLIGSAQEAPHLAATVNIAGFQFANAAGAWIGSATLGAGASLRLLPLVGALLAAGAFLVFASANTLAKRREGASL